MSYMLAAPYRRFFPSQMWAIEQQLDIVQNVSPEYPNFLIDKKKLSPERLVEKDEVRTDSHGNALRAIKADQFITYARILYANSLDRRFR